MGKALALLLVLVATPAHAATWYVATTGSDSNACTTEMSPCATIDGAEAKAIAAGDVIQIAAGTYAKDSFGFAARLTKSGTAGNPITYRGLAADSCPTTTSAPTRLSYTVATDPNHPTGSRYAPTVITIGEWNIQASYITIDCIEIRPNGQTATGRPDAIVLSGLDRDGITIKKFVITGNDVNGDCRNGILSGGTAPVAEEDMSADLTIQDGYITQCEYGFTITVNTGTVERVEIYRPRTLVIDMDYMRGWGNNLTIRKSYMYGATIDDCGPTGGLDCHIDCFMSFVLNQASPAVSAILKTFVWDSNVCFNTHQGVLLQDLKGRDGGTQAPTGRIDGATIVNSIFAHDPLSGEGMPWGIVLEAAANVNAYHNTIVGEIGGSGGIGYRYGSNGTRTNNLIVNFGANPLQSGPAAGTVTDADNFLYEFGRTYSGVSFPDAVLNLPPDFVDEANDDYDLGTGSPAIDVGNAGLSVDDDIDDVERDATPDIGAYEGDAPTEDPDPVIFEGGAGRPRFRR